MRKKIFDVITVGSALRDVLFYSDALQLTPNPSPDPTCVDLLCAEYGAKIKSNNVHFEFGGGAANTAVNLAGLHLNTAICTTIGADIDGKAIVEQLKRHNVDTRFVKKSTKHRTGMSCIVVHTATNEHVSYVYYGAVQDLDIREADIKKHKTQWYYISSLNTPHWRNILTVCFSRTTTRVAWNPGGMQISAGFSKLRRFLSETSILILNRDEATQLVLSHPQKPSATSIPQMLRTIHAWGPNIVLITDGRKGSYVYNGKQIYSEKPPQDKPKDTTGAGDCFGSSFLAGYIHYASNIQRALKLATNSANQAVRKIGAQNGLPTWDELPKHLKVL